MTGRFIGKSQFEIIQVTLAFHFDIILSKDPMSQCFFCGGGGPESVAEVDFAKDPGAFQVDDLITVRGKLKLNSDDLDHINFILTEAVLIKD